MKAPLAPLGRFIAGDPIRGIACLAVLIYHVLYASLWATGYPQLTHLPLTDSWGPIGLLGDVMPAAVLVFLTLSGYLIGRPFIRAFVLGREHPPVGRYAVQRALRLLPALWVVIGLVLLIRGAPGLTFGELVSAMTLFEDYHASPFANSLPQGWTLHVEAMFYIVTPLIALAVSALAARRLSQEGRLRLVAGLAALLWAASVAWYGQSGRTDPLFTQSFAVMAVAFLPGVLFAALELRKDVRRLSRPRAVAAATGIAGAGLVFAVTGPLDWPAWVSFELDAIGIGLLVGSAFMLERQTGATWSWLDTRPLHWAGQRSYSIYLLHWAVMGELFGLIDQMSGYKAASVVLLATTLAITLGLSELTYRFVERPAMRLGHRLWLKRPTAELPTADLAPPIAAEATPAAARP